jgi:hypothetical protein
MATVSITLYDLWQEQRFVTSPTNDAAPVLPTASPGDTWAIHLYYLDNTSPRKYHRFSESSYIRFWAQGNNHVYASGSSASEIAPATGLVVSTVTNGGGSVMAKKHFEFASDPDSGTFTITFTAPATSRGNDPAVQGMWAAHGTTSVIDVDADVATIAAKLNSLQWQKYDEHGDKVGGLVSAPAPSALFVVSNRTATGFDVQFGTSLYAGAGGVNCNPQAYSVTSPSPAHPTTNDSAVNYVYGWNIDVPLTDSDFSDVFLSGLGPAYFELYLNNGFAGRIQLTAAPGGGGNNAPAFTNGPPPASAIVGNNYGFTYLASGFPAPTFAVTSGALPPGLSLSAGGGLVGVPTTPGTYNGDVTATNSIGSATQPFHIVISSFNTTPTVSGAIYDGNYAVATPHQGLEKLTLIENQPLSLIYRHKYHQLQSSWSAQPLGTVCPYDSNFQLVFETPRIDIGGGIVEWTREWANVPPAWSDSEIWNYPYQQVYDTGQRRGDGSVVYAIISATFSRKANVTHSYYATDDPSTIPVNRLPRAIVFNGYLTAFDGFQNINLGTITIAGDDELRHYRGRIWERIERYIKL